MEEKWGVESNSTKTLSKCQEWNLEQMASNAMRKTGNCIFDFECIYFYLNFKNN